MKKIFHLVIISIMAMLFIPNVNAEVKEFDNIVYKVQDKMLEDYLCEDIKGHDLNIAATGPNKIEVYDNEMDKYYQIDFSNLGVCKEVDGNFYDDEPYREYSWDGNKLYNDTYDLNVKIAYAKTLDKEIEKNSPYAEKGPNGELFHVENPVLENLSNYYEPYLFELAQEAYDKDANYYKFVQHEYFTEGILVELDEATYEVGKYYVFAKPVKRELLVEVTVDEFVATKEKTGLETNITLTQSDFIYHAQINNNVYLAFSIDTEEQPYYAFFDKNGNYQTFGFDVIALEDILGSEDGYISLVANIEQKKQNVLLDKYFNRLVLQEVNRERGIIMPIASNENIAYFINEINSKEFIEISAYYLVSGANQKFDNQDLTFKFSGELGKLSSVKVNNEELKVDYYTKESGSTIITLSKEYLTTLKKGDYTLKVEYNDGGYVETTFTVGEIVPNTLDNIGTSFLIGILSLVGLIGVTVYLTKNNKKVSNKNV